VTDDIDGVWTGAYTHARTRCGVTVRFALSGGELRGSMTDAVSLHEHTLADLRAHHGLTDEQAEAIVAALREHVPEAEAWEVVSVSRLPPAAELTGYVHGSVVRFRKQYQGLSWTGWRVGAYLVGAERPGHAVEYEGEVSDDGGRIAGRWWIPANPALGFQDAEGTFELRRS
jgi:hypothetical protein